MLCLARYEQTHDRRWIGAAEDFFAHSADANPDSKEPWSHLERALILSLTGNPDTDRRIHPQIALIDRDILRVDPFDPFVRKNLAEALYRGGRKQEAQEELRHAIEIEPNYVAAYLTMADWANEAGNIDGAAQYRQKAMDIDTKYPEARRNGPYEHLLLARPEAVH
jgi:tetratricopeptide (TPR) repeat protein